MMLIQDMVGTTYHAAKIIARSYLKRELIATIVPNAMESSTQTTVKSLTNLYDSILIVLIEYF